jgi:hypothetical protein
VARGAAPLAAVPGLKLKEAGHLQELVAEFAAKGGRREKAATSPPSAAP